MPRSIETARLHLRPFRPADAADVARLVADFDVARWLTRAPHPYDEDMGRAFIADNADNPMVLAVRSGGALVGCMSILSELGYWIGKPFWGRGYATEAARALLDDYFATGAPSVRSGHILGNRASRNVLTKLGFVDGAVETAASVSLGRDVEIQRMHLAADAWKAAR